MYFTVRGFDKAETGQAFLELPTITKKQLEFRYQFSQ